MTTGEKLQSLRKQNNYTQEDLAEIMNVSRQSISKWESDIAFPETEKLIALSKLYKCSIDYLLKDEINEPVSSSVAEEKAISNKAYNKKRLPLIITTLGTCVFCLILFAITWFEGAFSLNTIPDGYTFGDWCVRANSSTFEVRASIFGLLTIVGDPFVNAKALKVMSIVMMVFLSIIVTLCVLYICIDKNAFKKTIRISNCLLLFLIDIVLVLSLATGLDWTITPSLACTLVAIQILLQYIVKPIRVCR